MTHPLDIPGQEMTLDSLLQEMEVLEKQIAAEHKLICYDFLLRLRIYCAIKNGTIPETETVLRWLDLYASLSRFYGTNNQS